MRRQGRILVVDDEPQWRELLVGVLSHTGYIAEAAATVEDASNMLAQCLYHVIILDIQLEGHGQDYRDSMTLLSSLKKRGLDGATKIIMYSGHGMKEQIHAAFCDFNIADFLSKEDFNHQHFLENVHLAFGNHTSINSNLPIYWADIGTERTVNSLQIENKWVNQNEVFGKSTDMELKDLLQRLFSSAESITVKPLSFSPSRSKTCVLSVQPFYLTGSVDTVVVKFGQIPMIEKEEQNFKDSVWPFISGTCCTNIENEARTPLLGSIVYSLLGTSTDNWMNFEQFYWQNDIQKIISIFDRLFHEICGSWYANSGPWLPRNLTKDYCHQFGSSIEQLEGVVKDTLPCINIGNGQLSFPLLTGNRLFTNPFQAIKGRTFVYSTHECITHGDLNQYNILVDSGEGVWLIDFEKTERSHILRDIATLDSVIRFQLLEAEEATLDECLAMEEALLSIMNFSQLEHFSPTLRTKNSALEKAYQTACYLRKLAWWTIGHNTFNDMGEYYVALLYNALFTLQFFSLSTRQREYALLSASLLADQLTKEEWVDLQTHLDKCLGHCDEECIQELFLVDENEEPPQDLLAAEQNRQNIFAYYEELYRQSPYVSLSPKLSKAPVQLSLEE